MRASTGTGIVTSFVLQSDDLDEIDWEWLGTDTAQVQTNYFGKGDTTTYDRGAYHPVASPQDTFHTYSIDWTQDYVKWYINGNLVRTLNYADAKDGTRFPQTPMQIKLGTWCAGGKDSPKGTVEWAGGYTNFDEAPFLAYYQSITIQDYSKGVSGAQYYTWADKSDGSYDSITVLTDGSSASVSSTSTSTSTEKSTATGGSKTTLATITSTTAGGLTQATNGVDVDTTVTTSAPTKTGTAGIVSSTSSTTTSPTSSGTAATGAASRQSLSNAAVVGAGLFLGALFV